MRLKRQRTRRRKRRQTQIKRLRRLKNSLRKRWKRQLQMLKKAKETKINKVRKGSSREDSMSNTASFEAAISDEMRLAIFVGELRTHQCSFTRGKVERRSQ